MRFLRLLHSTSLVMIACVVGACALSTEQRVAREERKVTFRTAGAAAATWSPEGSHFAVADQTSIWIFSAATLEEKSVLRSPSALEGKRKYNLRYGWGNSVEFLGEDQIATSGMGASVTVWQVESGQHLQSYNFTADAEFVVSLAYSAATATLAAGTSRGLVVLLRPSSDDSVQYLIGFNGIVHDLQFSADGQYLGAVGSADELLIWDLKDNSVFDRHPTPRRTMDIEKMGKPGQFLVAGETVEVWNFVDQEESPVIAEPSLVGQSIVYAALTTISLLGGGGVGSGNDITVACKRSVSVSPDDLMIADMHPGTIKEVIRIIDLATQEVITTLNPRGGLTCGMEFSPDGRFLLAVNSRGAHLYDTQTWQVKQITPTKLPR